MTIKEAFEKAENGTLTYEQFQELTKDSKFADLTSGDYVSKKKFDDEIATRDGQITTLNETIATRNSDLEDIKKKLADAGEDKTALTKLTDDMNLLQKKYTDDMQAYQDKLAKQEYEFAVKEFANSKNFTSKAAKKDFVRRMVEENLKLENGIILGAEDFAKVYSDEDPEAFVVKENEPDPEKPHFVDSTTSGKDKKDEGLFKFNFAGVR